MSKKTLEHSFNVLLSQDDYARLDELAHEAGLPMSTVVRHALKSRYLMTKQAVPTCADGTPCRVPQMHAQPSQAPGAG